MEVLAPQPDENESSSLTSSDDSEDEVVIDSADMEKMIQMQTDLEANPKLYETHIQVNHA